MVSHWEWFVIWFTTTKNLCIYGLQLISELWPLRSQFKSCPMFVARNHHKPQINHTWFSLTIKIYPDDLRKNKGKHGKILLISGAKCWVSGSRFRSYKPIASPQWRLGLWVFVSRTGWSHGVSHGFNNGDVANCSNNGTGYTTNHDGWLVICNIIIPTDELIFFRGVGIPPTRW
jgi:hypothetical protein